MSTYTDEAVITPPSAEVTDIDKPATLSFPVFGPDFILPRWIYIQDMAGRFLTHLPGAPEAANLTFSLDAPAVNRMFEPERRRPDTFHLAASDGNHIVMWGSSETNETWYGINTIQNSIAFTFVPARGNIVYMQDIMRPPTSLSSQLRSTGSPLALRFLNQESQMRISIAADNREITGVQYETATGSVRAAPSRTVLTATIQNTSNSAAISQTLHYSYERWALGTWHNAAGLEIDRPINFSAGVPFVSNGRFDIAVTNASTQAWAREDGVREVVNSSTTVVVPPRRRAQVTVTVRDAQINVRFAYTERISWVNGQTQERRVSGVYANVDSWDVDVGINWGDI